MKRNNTQQSLYQRIYTVVSRIPYGKVASYGQIAELVDRCTPRMVGYAMARVSFDMDVPWHRVVNSKGMISTRADGKPCEEQRFLLENEGVGFDESGRIALKALRWKPHYRRACKEDHPASR